MPETTTTTIAAELRTAAAKLREMAKPATPGLWFTADCELYPRWIVTEGANAAESNYAADVAKICPNDADAFEVGDADWQWMAFASPALAEPLASWLEEYADWAARSIEHNEELDVLVHESEYCDGEIGKDCRCFDRALAVARVINGTTPVPLPLRGEA